MKAEGYVPILKVHVITGCNGRNTKSKIGLVILFFSMLVRLTQGEQCLLCGRHVLRQKVMERYIEAAGGWGENLKPYHKRNG